MRAIRIAILLAILACVLASPVRAEGWGTVKGQVVLIDKVAIPTKLLKAEGVPQCKEPIPDDSLLVNKKNRGVQWAVVWLVKDDDGTADHKATIPTHPSLKNLKEKQVVMDQPCCRFEPHIVVLRPGQDFVGKNSATIQHNMNVIGTGPNKDASKNQLIIAGGTMEIPAAKWAPHYLPSLVKCDIHNWMHGRVFILANPYFAITDKDGKFEIKNAPAGKFRIMMWHEKPGYLLGEKDKNGQAITIKADGTTDLGTVKLDPTEE